MMRKPMNATGRQHHLQENKTGDTNGTISDADGAYEIALPDGGIDLLFSYIGYENEQLPLILRKGDTKTKDVYMNIKRTCWET